MTQLVISTDGVVDAIHVLGSETSQEDLENLFDDIRTMVSSRTSFTVQGFWTAKEKREA